MSDEVAPEHTALSEAINQASEETLRLILHDLVETCQVTRERLAMFLLVDEFEVRTFARDPPPFGPASSQLDSSRGESSDSERRKQVPRFALCAACEQEYDVTENTIRSCWYHPR
ncbi:hypothetical protein BDV25DRAFT_145486 [Aspergillus avenaceus]|uniref:Uncharacterized protein n=1 Tax=Aspergillus avenaceus TaxID=36643 RepID=A0A5N6TE94_ASPAV|nr:hypothetical protein BDV25DRAFT_145486 [Aspergillus avenaceus]